MKIRERKRTNDATLKEKWHREKMEEGRERSKKERREEGQRRRSTPLEGEQEEEGPRRAPRRPYFKGTEGFIYLLIGNHRTFPPCTISNDFARVTSKSFYGRFNCILLILPSP